MGQTAPQTHYGIWMYLSAFRPNCWSLRDLSPLGGSPGPRAGLLSESRHEQAINLRVLLLLLPPGVAA